MLLPIIVVLVFAAEAHAFTLEAPPGTINVPTQGSRDIIIKIESDVQESVSVNLADAKTWTTLNSGFYKLSPGSRNDIVLAVSPLQATALGLYKVTIVAESLTTQLKVQKDIFISVYKGDVVDTEKIIVAGDAKPTAGMSVLVSVKNYKTVPSNEVVLNIVAYSPSRKLAEFTDIIDNINPDERENRTHMFNLPKQAEAGTYRIVATLLAGGESREATQTFSVESKPVISTTVERTPLMFGFAKKVTVTNDGNEEAPAVTLSDSISGIEGVFFAGDQPAGISGETYSWIVKNVSPGEVVVIDYRIDYLPLFVFIVALIIIFWIVFFKLRTVRIKKYIIQKKELEEGEEFTVGIEIKNALGRKVDEVTVRDFVPPVFDSKDMQNPAPSRKKTAAGQELTWRLRDVHHREERLVSYRIIPVFGVHGEIRLPRASATFRQGKREATNRSTHAFIGVATERELPLKRKGK